MIALDGNFSFRLYFLVCSLIFISCEKEHKISKEIASIPIDVKVDRFDLKFGNATPQDLPLLIKEYPYLFPDQYDTDFWERKIKDTLQIELNDEVAQIFPDFQEEELEIELLYKHVKYYFPRVPIPDRILTVTSDVDYHHPVILADSIMIVALDTYLGSKHKFYMGIQEYYAQNFNKDHIVVDAAAAFADKIIHRTRERRFLDEIIYHGKRLYLMEKLLPLTPLHDVISYSADQLKWADENEVNIWTYFVERELLFSTDSRLLNRFVNPGPFSKFYLEFDNESPPRLGRYIGWMIVKSYMDNNSVDLQEMVEKPSDEIFENAKYKPRK